MLWATLLIIAFRGVTAIIFNQATAPRADGTAAGAAIAQFPVTLAEAFAMEFGQVYLNFSPATQAQREQLMAELPAFFQAYAAGDGAALSRFEARGVSLAGLDGAVTFGSIASLHAPPGGATRQITVTVIWQVPAAVAEASVTKLAAAYAVSVTELQSGKWYVNEISAVTEAVEAK